MNGLSFGEESMTIYSAVLIQCQRVTDGQTDRRTDVQPISITCFSIADARKNVNQNGKYMIILQILFNHFHNSVFNCTVYWLRKQAMDISHAMVKAMDTRSGDPSLFPAVTSYTSSQNCCNAAAQVPLPSMRQVQNRKFTKEQLICI